MKRFLVSLFLISSFFRFAIGQTPKVITNDGKELAASSLLNSTLYWEKSTSLVFTGS